MENKDFPEQEASASVPEQLTEPPVPAEETEELPVIQELVFSEEPPAPMEPLFPEAPTAQPESSQEEPDFAEDTIPDLPAEAGLAQELPEAPPCRSSGARPGAA